ncbi:hypothetical protein Xsto_03610 [Xenorhabdus stockiae]|uniref:Uncharacterized protein n=1 Tax=Xenorhabdus stockiae TaxID=351614 RepID=A0A2D0KBG9_9GAMM|nr:hypothetical protein [Xenorhabdus stockiae]PHM60819.1 hypothetical protein Xsto_03610 [Xenorhabdus stockiae]
MTEVFKKHKYDDMALYKSTQSVAACDCHFEEKDGKQIKVIDVPVLTCECVWRRYQKEAEDIVAPGGKLIADPIERNKRINQAYAKIWLEDNRFQWAALAAFASKQVGCGLLHASEMAKKNQSHQDANRRVRQSAKELENTMDNPFYFLHPKLKAQGEIAVEDFPRAIEEAREASRNNKLSIFSNVPGLQLISGLAQYSFNYVYEMMALGNTTLFLDVYPLHAFYKQRGLKDLKTCINVRQKIYGNSQFPILWPIGQNNLKFGLPYDDILLAFEAIEAGDIAQGVLHLAYHEQINILQTTMYSDEQLVVFLWGNQLSYVTDLLPDNVAQPVELTLASQCQRIDNNRTIEFSDSSIANLANTNERMPFVLKAADRFDELLRGNKRYLIEESLKDIAAGGGVK